ncbi:MFS transporter [Williamsia maris]|uniref:MFS transporter, CP family, cyanate transporter n=1 Tax=Williamsia maris TaxID=72806 RepID=A0ABT1HFS7_9NOCA|nr:MFS transporter [Williamsia maris]MCP2177098.1 MFS transporter, CP family, cyanate transporter [Williamsia maris]
MSRSTPASTKATASTDASMAPWRAGVLAVTAVIALGVSLRLLFGSASSVISEIRDSYGLGSVEVALLTTGPVVCLGLGASVAPRLARRFSALPVAAGCMAVLALGSALRAIPGWPILLVGTVIGGLGIAVANVLGPVLIRLLFPHRIGAMTGLLTALICVSAGIASGITPPVTRAVGDSWRIALGLWAIPAAIAFVAVALLAGSHGRGLRRAREMTPAVPLPSVPAAIRPGAARMRWAITGFMGIQSLLAYATVAWLPTIYRDRGLSADEAGLIFAALSVASIVTALGVPVLATRLRSQRLLALAVVATATLGLLGVLGTGTWGAWPSAIVVGFGQGGALSLALVLMNLRSATAAEATALSAAAQTVGYLLAATGPLAMGVLHSATDGWSVPLIALTATMVPLAICGVVAGHPGTLGAPTADRHGDSPPARPPIHS